MVSIFHNQFENQLTDVLDRSRNGDSTQRPVSFIHEHVQKMENLSKDPAIEIPGIPPNIGRFALPHVQTFQGLFGSYSRAYRQSDEAMKHSRENARFMRNDPGIMECIESRQRSTALLDWQLIPEDEDSQDQKALCDELKKILKRIRRFTEYRFNLLHAVWYGRYAIQHSYNWVSINGRMRVMPWAGHQRDNPGWIPVNGDKLVFRYDDGQIYQPSAGTISKPDQLGILVGARHQTGDRIGKRWTVEPTGRGLAYFLTDWERNTLSLHKHMIEDGPWEDGIDAGVIHGVGIRSRIYWDWFQKQEMVAFLMSYLERSAGGIEVWTYPAGNKDALEKAQTAAKERLADGRNVIFFPKPLGEDTDQYSIQIIEPGLAGIDVMQNLLNEYYGHRIKRYILGQTLSSEASATGLGSGLAELHLDTLLQIIKYDATNLEETITYELVERIKNWNFPAAKNINVRFVINTEASNVEEKLESFAKAYQMGAKIKERDVMELIGASIPGEGDEVLQQSEQNPMDGYGTSLDDYGRMNNGNGAPSKSFRFDPNKMTDDVMAALFGDPELDGQKVTYVSEGGKWVKRDIPDAAHDTGDRFWA